jgi:hypothetical protein
MGPATEHREIDGFLGLDTSGEFLSQLSDYQLLKEDYASRSYRFVSDSVMMI